MNKKSVIFLGFGTSGRNVSLKSFPVWTASDWYTFLPAVKPARIYQIHDRIPAPANGRYVGLKEKCELSDALIVTTRDLGFSKQHIFDIEETAAKWGYKFFVSSYSYMFADAIREGVEKIYMVGIDLISAEYRTQVPGTLYNIDIARAHGIEVVCPKEADWRVNKKLVNWAAIEDGISLLYEEVGGNLEIIKITEGCF
ncbi:MAG: hypothetical protein A2020_16405 [Lentisphaerae bacterium GWF2_45_14]|nr:MAG: hypothetical protein A2020_16405 [Lentisphaerae bacterium GWF2_45_14]